MSKKITALSLLIIFIVGVSCSNIGKPPKKHHKGPKTNSSGKMHRHR